MVDPIANPLSSYYHKATEASRNDNNDLKQEDFLKLLVTQINAQDPLNPQEGADFLAQLAQFGVVDGIQKMEQSFSSFTDNFSQAQVLSATHLLDHHVYAPTDKASITDQPLQGRLKITEPGHASIGIFDNHGELVKSISMPNLSEGTHHFNWDLTNDEGQQVQEGLYQVRTTFNSQENGSYAMENYLAQKVQSLAVRQGEPVQLELENTRSVKLDDIEYIG